MKHIKKIIIIITLLFFNHFTFAQQGPPSPPGDPSTGGGPIGGSAPIGTGIAIMLSLGAAYGGQKVYCYWQSRKEELED